MSLRKPILRVTKRCPNCAGEGSYKSARYSGYDTCKRCIGTGSRDVKRNDPDFKKYYQEILEDRIDDLTTDYRNAKAKAFDIGEELRKYCKELDKVINK